MKKLPLLFTLVIALFAANTASAQSATADYFAGKWKISIFGTPNGDVNMTFVMEKKEGKLTGTVRDTTDKEISKITSIEESGKNITVAFNAQGYDVTVTLEPIDADKVKGSLMNMFDVKGARMKEEVQANSK